MTSVQTRYRCILYLQAIRALAKRPLPAFWHAHTGPLEFSQRDIWLRSIDPGSLAPTSDTPRSRQRRL
jgi:hypothetical protein